MFPVVFTNDWKTSAPWVGEYLPGTPHYQELSRYNEFLNEPLKKIGYDSKAIIFLVKDKTGAGKEVWNTYLCMAADPFSVACLYPLRKENNEYDDLSDDSMYRIMKKILFFGPFYGWNEKEREEVLAKLDKELAVEREFKKAKVAEDFAEKSAQVATAHVDSPLVVDERIASGKRKSFTVGANLTKKEK